MKKFRHYWTALVLAAGFFAVSCDDTDEVEIDPQDTTKTYDVTLQVEGKNSVNADYTVTAETGSTISARVNFTGSGMKRLYITTNSLGVDEGPYTPVENLDFKPDGSIGLENSGSSAFDFEFELPVPTIESGTYVYQFWATSGVGDFRDTEKRLAVGVGTITLNYGGANPDQDTVALKSFNDVKLFAPLEDGSSNTFISLIDGAIFKINSGAENAAKWDFGYFYTSAAKASLSSTANYETSFPFVNVDEIAGEAELNTAYFNKSEMTVDDFQATTQNGDLDFATPANQVVSGLLAGDVVEFEDHYGKKGLIYVEEVYLGEDASGFGSDAYIMIDIKVQP